MEEWKMLTNSLSFNFINGKIINQPVYRKITKIIKTIKINIESFRFKCKYWEISNLIDRYTLSS